MIEFKNVSKEYTKNKKVVENLDFKINDGEIFGFLGPNGAGKSTTIKMMTGILDITEGDIILNGKSIISEQVEAKKQFGYVPDVPDMFLKLKGIEFLNFIADIYEIDLKARKEKIERLSKEYKIYDSLNAQIQSYSHGMRQKLLVVSALLHSPKILILDEPMTGLDPKASHDLKEMMRKYKEEGNIVFFSTHVLEVAEKLCDRIGIINNGKLVFVGTYEEMKNKFKENASLEDLFLELTSDKEN